MSSRKVQALVLVALVLIVAGAVAASRREEKSEYCGSCHSHEAHFESWQASVHKDVECVECHTEPGVKGWIESISDHRRMERVEKAGGATEFNVKADSAFCLRCHSKAKTLNETETMKIPHGLHENVGLDCTSCHTGVSHPGLKGEEEETVKMSHDTCIACHEDAIASEDQCGKCHKAEAISETESFNIPHELHTGMGLSCVSCHGPQVAQEGAEPFKMSHDQCSDCHADAIEDSDQCTKCHKW